MRLDDFEQRLRRENLRPAPTAWREQILAAARAATPAHQPLPSPALPLRRMLLDWLWPHPAAWAGLVSCWVAVFLLNHAAAPNAVERARMEAGAAAAVTYLALLQGSQAETIHLDPQVSPANHPRPMTTRGDRSEFRRAESPRLT